MPNPNGTPENLVAAHPGNESRLVHGLYSARRELDPRAAEIAEALLEALPAEDRALWATAFYAGLRRGELRGLRWSDIDLPARELRVRRSWDAKEGPIEGKTAAARRTVPIVGALAPELAQHKLRSGRDGGELVFGATGERAFEPSTVRRRALAAWKRVGLAPIGLHEARHTFASTLIAAGVNAKAITEAMGHASVTMTFDRYGHLMPDGREEARQRVDAYLQETGRVRRPTTGVLPAPGR
jgi:integrase